MELRPPDQRAQTSCRGPWKEDLTTMLERQLQALHGVKPIQLHQQPFLTPLYSELCFGLQPRECREGHQVVSPLNGGSQRAG